MTQISTLENNAETTDERLKAILSDMAKLKVSKRFLPVILPEKEVLIQKSQCGAKRQNGFLKSGFISQGKITSRTLILFNCITPQRTFSKTKIWTKF